MNMKTILSACIVATGVAGVMPAGAQDSTPSDAATNVREYQVVSSRQMAAGQGASAAQITSEIVQDVAQTTTPDGSVAVTTTPTRATVGVSGAGTADVPLDNAASATVSSADLDAAAPPSAVTVVDDDSDDDASTSLRVESDLPVPAGSGVSGGPVTVNTNTTTATPNGEPVAAVTTYASEPISFTTAAGDTVVMRTEGFSATDPAIGQPIASGSRAIGQTLTASGDLVPFAMQSSSLASVSAGDSAGNGVAGLGAVAGLLSDYSGPLSSGPASGDGAAPPAWLSAVAGVMGGVDALAASASAPGTAGDGGPGGNAWAALGQANNSAADAVVGPAVAAAGGSYAGLGSGNGNDAGDGSGAAGSNAGALANAARGAFGGADAGNDGGGRGVTVSSSTGASAIAAASDFGGAGDPIAMALGNGGSADTAAFGGAAIYGSGPSGGGGLPDLGAQVIVSDPSVARNAIANLAVASATLFALPPSSGGFTTISVPNQLFTFSVFDSGGIDNEDVINITFINNGASVPVSPSGSNVTLFFLTNGQGTTFDAVGNPAVASNEFTVPISPGSAQLNFEAVSSAIGPNTGAVEITSPVLVGENSQVFELPQAGGDFARLSIEVQP